MQYTDLFFFSVPNLNMKISSKNLDIFLIFIQNIACGYKRVPTINNLEQQIREIGTPVFAI